MPKFQQEYFSDYSVEQLYDLVVDIEKYPEFLQWCSAARIVEETNHEIIADLFISYKAFTEHYRSKVVLIPPDNKTAIIKATSIQGPFKHLYNEWRFEKIDKRTKIHFSVDFELRSGLLKTMIGLFFSKACEKMVLAFDKRAHTLYKEKNEKRSTFRNW